MARRRRRQQPPTTYQDFARHVESAGLTPRNCTEHHWQIRGGERLVNCWPHGGQLRIHVDGGGKSRLGTIRDALRLAGVRPKPADESPPWEEPKPPVRTPGVLRRCLRAMWRFLW